eukprot:70713_1
MAQQPPNQGQVGGQGPLPANVPPLPPLPELPIFAPQVPYNQGGGVPPAGAVPQAQGQLAGLLAQIQHIQGLGAVAGQPPPPAMPAPLGQPLAAQPPVVQPPAAAAVPANPWAQLAGLLQRQIPRVGGAQLGFGQFIPPQAVGLGSDEQMCRTGRAHSSSNLARAGSLAINFTPPPGVDPFRLHRCVSLSDWQRSHLFNF